MWPLFDAHKLREYFLANCIEQERRFPVLRTPRDRRDRMAYEAACNIRREQNGCARGLDFLRTESSDRTPTGFATNRRDILEFSGVARRRVVVISLHFPICTREQCARDAVARLSETTNKTMAVAVSPGSAVGGHGRAFTIVNTGIHAKARGLALDRIFNPRGGINRPWVVQIKFGEFLAHQVRIGEP